MKQLARFVQAKPSSEFLVLIVGLAVWMMIGCTSSSETSGPSSAPSRVENTPSVQTNPTVAPTNGASDERSTQASGPDIETIPSVSANPTVAPTNGASDERSTQASGPDIETIPNCPPRSGPAVAVNRWSQDWGNGLNEVWVIPIAEADLSLEDSQGNPITLVPGSDPNADTRVEIKTYAVGPDMESGWDAHHACNLTQTDLVNEYVLASRPESTEVLIYRTNEYWCETFIGYELPQLLSGQSPSSAPPQSKADCEPHFWQIVLTDISTGTSRVIADFGEQIAKERLGGGVVTFPMFSSDTFQTRFSPDGSRLSYVEPCWQGARHQEALGTTDLIRENCQDGGYLVVTDLESMSSRVIHGSENDAAIIAGHAWSPDGSSILIRQMCSEKAGVLLPEDTERDELAACNGIWTVDPSQNSDHFETKQTHPINRFFDCDNWDGSVIADAIWSPDGNAITVSGKPNVECKRGVWEIDIHTGEFSQIAACPFDAGKLNEPESCGGPKWSPDGELFLFIADSDGDGNVEIWVSNKDGQEPRHISPWYPGPEENVEWSPDSEQIAFHTFWHIHPSLLTVNVTDPTKVATVPYSGSGVRGYGFAWLGR
ncbi:MAG: hypothetical protein QF756_04480 [Dehalococcoidia bacterium]|jgi:hypothetical protein|nr:hypothetical protein [Dehalococcoidia bacterium]MDP7515065.1 hypothetical protein [Dehalococcoidia bacterium]